LTSVHHPILVHRADEEIKFCIDNGCLEIQEDTNEWLGPKININTEEIHIDESHSRSAKRVINVYTILVSKERNRLGDQEVNGNIILKWILDG
jgi:hypothetical protein